MDIQYYAHSANDRGEKETVSCHLERTGRLCGSFLNEFGYGEWGTAIGRWHDFGKYSKLFQQVLSHQAVHIDHAAPGAVLAYTFLSKVSPDTAEMVGGVICSHHTRLGYACRELLERTAMGIGPRTGPSGDTLSLFGPQELRAAISLWCQDFQRPCLTPPAPDFSAFGNPSLARMLFMRFLFSGLVDADYCATAMHYEPDYLEANSRRTLDPAAAFRRLTAVRAEKQKHSGSAEALNRLRDALFETCVEAAQQPPGLFTLTAPTGLGKTLSLFAFAVKHCEKYHKRKIILVLPYLSIIEQNSREYRQMVPDLLELHSSAETDESNRVIGQRWSAPCIITTNVGFLEPLFSTRPAECRHLHEIAGSVIVFDEAQSLPPELLDATLNSIRLLCGQYGCSVVFSTATQPAFEFRPGLVWNPREIVPEPETLYRQISRVKYEWVKGKRSFAQIAQSVSQRNQVCVIVNLKRHARDLYERLCAQTDPQDVFFLTSDLCPAHRSRLLEDVRDRLQTGVPCRLVSTQCIEAGVDLDFPVVYRALAPLDSIVQAAGRCNRNGDSPDGRVIVFEPEGENLYPSAAYEAAANCVKTLLSRHPVDGNDPQQIREYYELLYRYAKGDKKPLRDAIESGNFAQVEKEYKLIEKQGVQVIVPYIGQMELYHEIRRQIDAQGVSGTLLRKAAPITVSSYDKARVEELCQCLTVRDHDGTLVPTGTYLLGIPAYYDDVLGFSLQSEPFDGIL
jgi:CRISPR-associated endonuclease/helicase Cas3